MRYDILIINGTIPDFKNNCMLKSNVGVKNGKIEYIGNEFPEADKIIDATERIVAPGFIDIHMHEDDFRENDDDFFTSLSMLRMGVTTALGGNCGSQRQRLSDFKENIENKGGSPVNYLMLAGYNYFRTMQGIDHYEHANAEQIEYAKKKCIEEIERGAIGISFGIEYDPGITFEEMKSVCEILDNDNQFVSAHLREDAIENIDSINEAISLSMEIPQKFQISHLVSTAAMSRKKLMKNSLERIKKARTINPNLDFDTYPYNAFSTHIGSAVFDDGCFERWGKGYDSIQLTKEPYRNVRCDENIFNDARKNHPDMYAIAFVMNEDEVSMAIADENGMIGSDGIVDNHSGHPRARGTFPRILAKYVRDDKVIDMITALRKMSFKASERLGLYNKGRIEVGCDADIVVFDPETISDKADFSHLESPIGFISILINGKEVLKNDEVICTNGGRFISAEEIISNR